jgi:alpha-glucosidase
MPWNAEPNANFSQATPWLPVPETHRERSVAKQEVDPGSVLHATRHFLRWRRSQPALVEGDIRFLDAPEPVLAFVRRGGGQSLLVVFNLSAVEVEWTLPADFGIAYTKDGHGLTSGRIAGNRLQLPPRGSFYACLG